MHPIARDVLLEQLAWRYATKKFDPARKIGPADWSALERALVLSPSSFGLAPWRFIVVDDPAVRQKLLPASWNQSQIIDASHLVVLARRTSMARADIDQFVSRIVSVRGVSAESVAGYRGMMLDFVEKPAPGFDVAVWTSRQVYIALGVFLSAAALLGIDACPMEGFDAGKYDQILGLTKDGYAATVIATAGYRATDDAYASMKKVRLPDSEVVKHV